MNRDDIFKPIILNRTIETLYSFGNAEIPVVCSAVLEVPLHAFDSHWRPQVSPKVEALAQLLT